nr:immunoglobulin light chain junction region [Macaca mulatta]MPN97847.1 immunoglobulin light chain junction region [Macaca mulatta]
CQQRNLYPRTF